MNSQTHKLANSKLKLLILFYNMALNLTPF